METMEAITPRSERKKSSLVSISKMQYGDGEQQVKTRLQQYFIENHKSSFRIRLFNFLIKLLTCVLYCVRVVSNDPEKLPEPIQRQIDQRAENINRNHLLIWVDTPDYLWCIQATVACISIAETVLVFYISYKRSILQLLLNIHFLLELITSAPLILSIFIVEWRWLYVPIFLNCWLANGILEDILVREPMNFSQQYLCEARPPPVSQRSVNHSALFRQMIGLFSTLIALIFTGACGMEHLQRAGDRQFSLFNSLYFVTVTFSTVGYGDWYPDTALSRLYVIILIIVAFVVLPSKIEALGQTWLEREKAGFDYTKGFSRGGGCHVVVTITHLEADFIEDFLTEFYAHAKHQNYLIVLLSPCELDIRMKLLLKIPLWSHRVIYVRGSALKDEDLERAHMTKAKACFILSARNIRKKNVTDEQSVLRSWAVKDFAPNIPQYVQIFRPETKIHIEHAKILICEDEFKYSLLANNCLCPGVSTFITLLMHTSRGEEGQKSSENWHKLYGFHSGNEIYDIKVSESQFFGEYIGQSFPHVSLQIHKLYGICLVGVKQEKVSDSRIMLNPGKSYLLHPSDRVYYISLTNEESLREFHKRKEADVKNEGENAALCSKEYDVEKAEESEMKREFFDQKSNVNLGNKNMGERNESLDDNPPIDEGMKVDYPPIRGYIGATNATKCHILKRMRPLCCLHISQPCEHIPFKSIQEYKWKNPAVIVAVDKTSSGLYNLIFPLRAFYRPVNQLRPIVLLLELEENRMPNQSFLEAIAWFPEIYWIQGKISDLDNLLKAGISAAGHVIVIKESASESKEEHLADCSTILTVQKIHRMFPKLKFITELTHSSNMRFMQFNANDEYSLRQSRCEERERKRGSNLAFMFRLPFAAGTVFSAHMLDRLLYQAFVKDYLVEFLKILLGMDQSAGSGFLDSMTLTKEDLVDCNNYGRLYKKLCSSAEIPIGIYRTEEKFTRMAGERKMERERSAVLKRRSHISNLVVERMNSLGICTEEYENDHNTHTNGFEKNNNFDIRGQKSISYVIINPAVELIMQAGDIIYVLRSPRM